MINTSANEYGDNNADYDQSYAQQQQNAELGETYYASKVVDRVQCDICNKQVCNKYFLRTHKQKVHGIYENNGSGRESTGSSGHMYPSASVTASSSSTNQYQASGANGGGRYAPDDAFEDGDDEEEFMMMQQSNQPDGYEGVVEDEDEEFDEGEIK